MDFCPTCGNLLQYELPYMGRPARFFCRTCPYVFPITNRMEIKRAARISKKVIATIVHEGMDTRPTIEVRCPKECGSNRAYYEQKQIRSADEPMTTFYECTACGDKWRED